MSDHKTPEALSRLIEQRGRVLRKLKTLMSEQVRLVGDTTDPFYSINDKSAVRLGHILDAIEDEILSYPIQQFDTKVKKAEAIFDMFLDVIEVPPNERYVQNIQNCFEDMKNLRAG